LAQGNKGYRRPSVNRQCQAQQWLWCSMETSPNDDAEAQLEPELKLEEQLGSNVQAESATAEEPSGPAENDKTPLEAPMERSPTAGRRKQRTLLRLSVTTNLAHDHHGSDSGSPTSLTSPKLLSPRPMAMFEAEAILAGPQSQSEEELQRSEDASIRRLRDHLREKYGSNETVWEALDAKGLGSLSLRGLRDALEAESINVENVVRGRHDLRGLFKIMDYGQVGRITMIQLMHAHPRIERRKLAAAVKFVGPDFEDPPVDVQPLLEAGSDLAQSMEWTHKLAGLMQEDTDEKKDLLLHHCCIGEAGAKLLAAQLRATYIQGLREINLRANYIGDMGVRNLAQALECRNHCVEKIVLPWNGLSDKGAARIARMITQLTTLKELDISFNRISSPGAAWLSEALSIRPALRNLTMQGNRISAAWAERLRDAGGTRCAVDVEGIDVEEPETTAPPKREEVKNPAQLLAPPKKSGAARKSAKPRGSATGALPQVAERRGGVAAASEQPSPKRRAPTLKKVSAMWTCDPAHPLPRQYIGREWMGEGARITCTKFAKIDGPRPLTRQIMSRSGREQLIVRRKDAFFPGLARKPVTPMTKTSSLDKPMTPLTLPTVLESPSKGRALEQMLASHSCQALR